MATAEYHAILTVKEDGTMHWKTWKPALALGAVLAATGAAAMNQAAQI